MRGYGAALDGPQDDGLLNAEVEARLAGLRGAEGLDAARICAYIREADRALELQTGRPDTWRALGLA